MGKGTRNRQDRAQVQVATPSKQVKKQNKSVFYGTLAMGIFAVVLVVSLLLNALVGAGVFMRARTVAETDDFEVNGAVMSYYIHEAYSSYVNYYKEMYSSFLSSSSSLSIYNIIGIDPNVSLKKQVMDEKTGQTWFQYFAEQATTQIEEILVYCQAAKAAGVKLDEQDIASIDMQVEYLSFYAQIYGYSYTSYLSNLYGKGVKEKDVRQAMELSALASKYAKQVQEGYYDASTDETVEKFYNDNKNDYISADYLIHVFTAKKDTKEKDAEKAKADYEALKEKIEGYAKTLSEKTTAEEFKQYIKENWLEENEKTYRTKYYEDLLKEVKKANPDATEEDNKAAAEKKLKEKLEEGAEDMLEDLLVEDYKYNVSKDLGKWIFGEKDVAAAAVNTTKVIKDDSKDKDGTYTITVYFLTRAASRVEDTTRTFSYMMLTGGKDGFTLSQAEAALSLFKKGEKVDQEGLEELARSETYKKSTFNSLEELKQGSVELKEFDEWLYAEDRKAGDYDLITCTYNNTMYYVLAYVEEIGPAEWYVDARDGMVADQMETYYEEQSKTHAVTINQKAIDKTRM